MQVCLGFTHGCSLAPWQLRTDDEARKRKQALATKRMQNHIKEQQGRIAELMEQVRGTIERETSEVKVNPRVDGLPACQRPCRSITLISAFTRSPHRTL
jgi:hypothetical protein